MNQYQQLLEAALKGEREIAPVTQLLGIELVAWSPGLVRLEMVAGAQHHNPNGVVHGGIICDLADAALGCAVASAVDPRFSFTTVDLNISFFRPIRAARIAAEARVLRMGRRTCYVECDVTSEGQLTAKATSTLMLIEHAGGASAGNEEPP